MTKITQCFVHLSLQKTTYVHMFAVETTGICDAAREAHSFSLSAILLESLWCYVECQCSHLKCLNTMIQPLLGAAPTFCHTNDNV